MKTKCIVCGKLFTKSPSANIVTCSPECSRRRRSAALTGHKVSKQTKQKISAAAQARGFTENLAKGTPAAQISPKAGRFETNSSAKSWELISPDGRLVECVNLNQWLRNHIDYFNVESTDENVRRIAAGFHTIKRNIKRGRGCPTYKGWSVVIQTDDRKNAEKEGKND